MKIELTYSSQSYMTDLNQPIDISIPIGQVRCFYAPKFETTPYESGDFIGSVSKGAPVNFYNVSLNPHGQGTHTECLGHITKAQESINQNLFRFHFFGKLITVGLTEKKNGDKIISKESLSKACENDCPEALIIRTKPNYKAKLKKDYSDTNPPYLDLQAMKYLVKKGVKHLLIDLPSVDREVDKGKLAAHHIFWNVKDKAAIDKSRVDCTITELIYVPNDVKDGLYLLNIQIPSLELDAAPSKPVIYKLTKA